MKKAHYHKKLNLKAKSSKRSKRQVYFFLKQRLMIFFTKALLKQTMMVPSISRRIIWICPPQTKSWTSKSESPQRYWLQ
jgi:hypothetical protein